MKILIACEESQRVCMAFRNEGHEAYSCDIIECSGGHPEWHIKTDVVPLLNGNCEFQTADGEWHSIYKRWDMIIAFPPCTHLAVSGARYFEAKRADGRQLEAIKFFAHFLNCECDKVVIENPVGIIGGKYIKDHFPQYSWMPKSSQIIQPYDHGDPYRKSTCLWVKGVPLLKPTKTVNPHLIESTKKNGCVTSFSGAALYVRGENGKILKWADPRTAKERSKTYPGVAKAMAAQWGREV